MVELLEYMQHPPGKHSLSDVGHWVITTLNLHKPYIHEPYVIPYMWVITTYLYIYIYIYIYIRSLLITWTAEFMENLNVAFAHFGPLPYQCLELSCYNQELGPQTVNLNLIVDKPMTRNPEKVGKQGCILGLVRNPVKPKP